MRKRKENNGNVRKLRQVRLEHKYSLRDLSRLLDVHYTTVSYWENGLRLPDEANAKKLENCFNMSIKDLLEEAGTENKYKQEV